MKNIIKNRNENTLRSNLNSTFIRIISDQIRKLILFVVFILGLTVSGCKKFVDVQAPITSLNGTNVFATDATAMAVLSGLYTLLGQGQNGLTEYNGNATSISARCGLSADELTLNSTVADLNKVAFYQNKLISTNTLSSGTDFWANIYSYLYKCNDAIEGLSSATKLTPSVRQQLIGEAKFLRAFFYFYLVNLYGDAPLITSTDYQLNSQIPRSSTVDVYKQIVTDLKEAQSLLNSNYLNGNLQQYTGVAARVRPNSATATALLARVYLYTGDYTDAEIQSTTVINNSMYLLEPLNNAFLKNSREAIWQLQPLNSQRNTEDAFLFILPTTGPNDNNKSVYLSNGLVNSFESGDQRRYNRNWIDSVKVGSPLVTYYFPYKYKNLTSAVNEYVMVFRLAEQYLIRAEARAQLNNISGAQADLNAIRTRAVLGNTSANDKPSLLTAILQERRVEFFSEWGHRWLDLKRTNNIDAVMTTMTPIKSNGTNTWQPYQKLYPLPFVDLQRNPNLVQNPGY